MFVITQAKIGSRKSGYWCPKSEVRRDLLSEPRKFYGITAKPQRKLLKCRTWGGDINYTRRCRSFGFGLSAPNLWQRPSGSNAITIMYTAGRGSSSPPHAKKKYLTNFAGGVAAAFTMPAERESSHFKAERL
jgi:hypothetical protein